MNKIFLVLLFCSVFAFGQKSKKSSNYNFGKNGIEYIAKTKSGKTIIISTFNSKPSLKDEIAVNVYKYFVDKSPENGEKIIVESNKAFVKGICFVNIKDKLTSIEFHYESIKWKTGLTEVYNKPTTIVAMANTNE